MKQAIRTWDRGDVASARSHLTDAVQHCFRRIRGHEVEALVQSLEELRNDPTSSARLDATVAHIHQLVASGDVSPTDLLWLRYVTYSHGFISLGSETRFAALAAGILRIKGDVPRSAPGHDDALATCALATEERMREVSDTAFEQVKNSAPVASDLARYRSLVFDDGVPGMAVSPPSSKVTPSDDAMDRLVRGRSVAIVGPSPSDAETGEEIDDFDVVIRMVLADPRTVGDPRKVGRRTDVACYSDIDQVCDIFTRVGPGIVASTGLKVAVIRKPPRSSGDLTDVERESGIRVRVGHGPCIPFIFGTTPIRFQKVPMAYADVIRFGPSRVKLFTTTMYVGDKLYRDGFASQRAVQNDPRSLCSQFRSHDPIGNHAYLRNAWLSGRLEVDEVSGFPIRLNAREVATELEARFGLHAWQRRYR